MSNRRENAVIIFADLSFLIITVLVSGYLFVELKEKDKSVDSQKSVSMKIVERLPVLPEVVGNEYLSGVTGVSLSIPECGGQFIIDGKNLKRDEVREELEFKNSKKSAELVIENRTPSGDTLYLLDILSELGFKVNLLYVPETNYGEK